jgi:hypothetical protein
MGKQWEDEHQQRFCTFQAQSLTNCGEAGRIRVSEEVDRLQAQSLTCYGKTMAGSASARDLHCASTITYLLWEAMAGSASARRSTYTLKVPSLTGYGNVRIGISKGVCTL